MKFKMVHENYNVRDLEKSLKFYEEALGLTEKKRIEAKDGSFIIVYVRKRRHGLPPGAHLAQRLG